MSDENPPAPGPPLGPPPAYSPYVSPESPVSSESPESSESGRRRRWVTVVLAAAVAVVALSAAIAFSLVNDDGRVSGGTPAADVNLDEVEFIEKENTTHTQEDVEYDELPPVGGPHNPVWLDCGVYDEPVPEENVVHDLEHGTVWVTYRPGLNQGDIDALAQVLPQNGILSPYDDLQSPVVVTVWGTRLELDGADDPRLPLFIANYGAGETAPEPGASCAGGLRDPPPVKGAGTSV